MTPCNCNRTTIARAVCVAFGFVSLSAIPPSLGYSPRLLHDNGKGHVNNKVVHREDFQQRNAASYPDHEVSKNNGRRGFIKTGVAAFLPLATMTTATTTPPANAFENRINDKYANAIAQTGTQPKDLGHSQRSNYVGLKQCGNSPNCWNSSTPKANIPARWLPAWEGNGRSIEDVKRVIDTYEVGQNDIDGGGFKIMEYNNNKKEPDDQYLYVQFQSYKAGYIDDFECWFNPESKKFDVRSASKVGYSDLGVNAQRLEYIANRLENEYGWTIERRKNGRLV